MSSVNAAVLTVASWVLVAVLAVMFGAALLRLVGIALIVVSRGRELTRCARPRQSVTSAVP